MDPSNNSNNNNNHNNTNDPPILFVWDFDHTVINCNSDEYVPAQLLGDSKQTKERFEHYMDQDLDWHSCVERVVEDGMSKIYAQCREKNDTHNDNNDDKDEDVAVQKLKQAAAQMPYLIQVQQTLQDIYNKSDIHDIHQIILSDGNTIFIQAFLEKNHFTPFFNQGIVSNVGTLETVTTATNNDDDDDHQQQQRKLLRVFPQSENKPHGCPLPPSCPCPSNLCKTKALKDILNRSCFHQRRPRIVYTGDGSNDVCPVLHVLKENDICFARSGWKRSSRVINQCVGAETEEDAFAHYPSSSETAISTTTTTTSTTNYRSRYGILPTFEKLNQTFQLTPQCQVKEWNTGSELRAHAKEFLSSL